MKKSKYFSQSEIACQCGCGFSAMNADTLDMADAVREFVDHPVFCGSGCRCVDHNFNIGGAVRSRHLPRHVEDNKFESDAMDLHLTDGKEIASVVDFLRTNYPNVTFFTYNWGIHIDTRSIQPGE